MFRQIRLLVFDLDYLIFDCGLLKSHALRQSLIALADEIPQHVRLPDGVDIETAFRDRGRQWIRCLELGLGEDRLADLEQVYRTHETRLLEAGVGRIFAGMTETLAACQNAGISCALGAEAGREYLMAVSDRHELDRCFEIVLCTEEYGLGSAGEMLGDMLSQAEVNPSEALVLGTRPALFQASRSLDLLTVGCAWGLQQQDAVEEADFQVRAVAQILPIIRRADEIAAEYAG